MRTSEFQETTYLVTPKTLFRPSLEAYEKTQLWWAGLGRIEYTTVVGVDVALWLERNGSG